MTNHVNYGVRFEQMNDAAKAKWKELTSRLVEQEYEYWMGLVGVRRSFCECRRCTRVFLDNRTRWA